MALTFLATLTAGLTGIAAIAPLRAMAAAYLRTVSLIVAGLIAVMGVLVWIAAPEAPPYAVLMTVALAFALAACLVAFATAARVAHQSAAYRGALLLAFLASVTVTIFALADADAPSAGAMAFLLSIVAQASGALLLGSVTLAWLLGHAYLTASTMPIAPLRFMSRLFFWASVLRTLVAALIAFVALTGIGGGALAAAGDTLMAFWLIAAMRVAVGLLLVVMFAWMVGDCVRLRNTQSATGILYFASVAAYVGELSSQYLYQQTGVGF